MEISNLIGISSLWV